MFLKAVFPGKYIQGEGVIAELPALVKLLGKKGLILTSATGRNRLLPPYAGQWRQEPLAIDLFQGECCEEELHRLAGVVRRDNEPRHLDRLFLLRQWDHEKFQS